MNAGAASDVTKDRLPPLGGGLLRFYQLTFASLAAGAALAITLPLLGSMADPVVTVLRSIKGLALIGVAAILFRRRQNDAVAALLSLAFLAWTITSSVDFTTATLWPQLLDRARFILFALALLLFPNGDWRPFWTRHAAVASIAVFLVGIVETAGIVPTKTFLPAAIGCILAALIALIASFRIANEEAIRKQLKWVALGLVAGIGLILSARLGATVMPLPVLWEAMFQSGISIVALGFLVSLLRYRLYDAEAAISRSAVLAALTLTLVGCFAATEAVIEWLGQQYLGAGLGNVSAAMAAAVAAVLLNPLHGRINKWAEYRFQRDLVELKEDLARVLADRTASATPAELGAAILPRICAGVHSDWAALVVEHKAMATHGIAVGTAEAWVRGHQQADDRPTALTTLDLDCPYSGRAGRILLGPRPDGSALGRDDLQALEDVRPALRDALAWARQRESGIREARRKDRAIQRRFLRLERRVERIEGGLWPESDNPLPV